MILDNIYWRNIRCFFQAFLSSLALYVCFFPNIEEIIIIVFIGLLVFYRSLSKNRGKEANVSNRKRCVCTILALYFSFILVQGLRLWEKVESLDKMQNIIIAFLGVFVLAYQLISVLFDKTLAQSARGHRFIILITKPAIFISMSVLIMIISWLPMLLSYYPGIVVADSEWQWNQALGVSGLNNHHPIIHTLVIRIAQKICELIFGELNVTYAVLIYSLIQMFIMAIVLSCIMCYMYKEGTSKAILVCAYLFYLVFPLHAMFSIYMTKDTLFSVFVFLLVSLIEKIYLSKGTWLKNIINCGVFFGVLFLVTFFRSNGFLVSFTVLVIIGGVYRKYLRYIVPLFCLLTVVYLGKGAVFSYFHIGEADIKEAIGMPINQIANVVVKDRPLSAEEIRLIENVLSLEEIKNSYSPRYSDPIKFNTNFDAQEIIDNKLTYLKLWIKLFLKYPKTCLDASLNLTIGYWYPAVSKGAVSLELSNKYVFLEKIGANPQGIIFPNDLYDYFWELDVRSNALLSWLFSIGNAVLLMFFILAICIYSVDYKTVIVFLPNIIVWFTMLIASPSYCETRYVYSIFLGLPFYINFAWRELNKNNMTINME